MSYNPPKVWTCDEETAAQFGRFGKINRPVAGPTHEHELPVGEHPIQLYSIATPNGVKVTVMLEELLALGHAGAEYTIADMAIWPWYGALVKGVLYDAAEFLDVQSYTHVLRWTKAIAARPAAKRGRLVNRVWGAPGTQLKERHDASDLDRLVAPGGGKAG